MPSNSNPFFLIYIDESKSENMWYFSALWVPCSQWNVVFARLKKLRDDLSKKYKIRVRK